MNKFQYQIHLGEINKVKGLNQPMHDMITKLFKQYFQNVYQVPSLSYKMSAFEILRDRSEETKEHKSTVYHAFKLITYAQTQLVSKREVKYEILRVIRVVANRLYHAIPNNGSLEDVLQFFNDGQQMISWDVRTINDAIQIDKALGTSTETNPKIALTVYHDVVSTRYSNTDKKTILKQIIKNLHPKGEHRNIYDYLPEAGTFVIDKSINVVEDYRKIVQAIDQLTK